MNIDVSRKRLKILLTGLLKKADNLIDIQLEIIDPALEKFKKLELENKVDLITNTHTPLGTARSILDELVTDFDSIKDPSPSTMRILNSGVLIIDQKQKNVSGNQDTVIEITTASDRRTKTGKTLSPIYEAYSDSCLKYLDDVRCFAQIFYPEKFPRESRQPEM